MSIALKSWLYDTKTYVLGKEDNEKRYQNNSTSDHVDAPGRSLTT